MSGSTDLLKASGISKSFPGVKALENVDFRLERGQIHALMGENGAGKSTLIKTLTGFYQPDAGKILLDGTAVHCKSPLHAQALGISTVYQEVNLIPSLSVAENLYLGREPKRFGAIHWKEIRSRAIEAVRKLGLDLDVNRELGSYSLAIQQMVAIARALDIKAKVLILDEPTSSLDSSEVESLFKLMRELRNQGLGIVFVTHFLDQVYAVSDRITVLRNGKLVGEFEAKSLSRTELVAKMMGKEMTAMGEAAKEEKAVAKAGTPLLEVLGLGLKGSVSAFDLKIDSGESVGLSGLLGSGRSEAARLLFGVDKPDSGKILVDGKEETISSPRKALELSFALCPEDRKTQSIIPDLSIRENIVLALQARRGWLRPISRPEQDKLAAHYMKALGIVASSPEQPIKNLSGGNQQKVILARWLASKPRVLILDEPTRGIDVGAKAEIAKLILSLRREGMAIIFISSELEETVHCCDRVAVMRDRVKVGELSGEDIQEEKIMKAIAGEPRQEAGESKK
jgi:simple sugar transport system ATP-binding protein